MRRLLPLLFLAVVGFAQADFQSTYFAAENPADQQISEIFRNARALESIATILNKTVSVPRDVLISGKTCGTPNAFYDPAQKEITICYDLMRDAFERLRRKLGGKVSDHEIGAIWVSELFFVAFHEAGHAVIHLHGLPVLGRQEDAADQFAAYILLATNQVDILRNALRFFEFHKPGLFTRIVNAKAIYSDEHALSDQRLANVICWGYGKSPAAFGDLVDRYRISRHRAQRCESEYDTLVRDVRTLLGGRIIQPLP